MSIDNIESTQEQSCTANKSFNATTETQEPAQRIFPCIADEEVRLALEQLLHPICIEVAGGIVRHHRSW